MDTPRSECFELVAADTKDAAVGTHPEVATLIVKDAKHSVAKESVGGCVVGEFAFAQTRQATVIGSDPQCACGIPVKRSDIVAGEPVFGCKRAEPPFVPSTRIPALRCT